MNSYLTNTHRISSTKQFAYLIGKSVKLFLQYYCPSADVCSRAERALKMKHLLHTKAYLGILS